MSSPSVSPSQHEYHQVRFDYSGGNEIWTPTPHLTPETVEDTQTRLENWREAAVNHILEHAEQAPIPEDQVRFAQELFGALDLPMKPFVILNNGMSPKNFDLISHVTGEQWQKTDAGRYFRKVELAAVDAANSNNPLRTLIHEEAHGANKHTTVYDADKRGIRFHFVAAVGRKKIDARHGTGIPVVGGWHDEAGCDLIGVNGERLYRKENGQLPPNGDTSIYGKYSRTDSEGNVLISHSAFPAQGLELLITRKPELFEAALHAGQSAENMREYIRIIDSFSPGLYKHLRDLPDDADGHLAGLVKVCSVLGTSMRDALLNNSFGKTTEDLMAAKIEAYRRNQAIAPAAASVAIRKTS